MKQQTERSTISYEPEAVTKEVSVEFNKITRAGNVLVGGEVKKAGERVGRIDYNQGNDSISLTLSAVSKFTETEKAALFKKVPEYLKEILAE